jgi:hypothetical protein
MTEENVETRLARLEANVATLMGARPGRRALPVVVKEAGVCGVSPQIDSASCPYASLYRRQKGCLGDACVIKSAEYYAERRKQDE